MGVLISCILFYTIFSMIMHTKKGSTEPFKTEFFGMNTYITFTAYGADAEEALKAAEKKISELEAAWSVTE